MKTKITRYACNLTNLDKIRTSLKENNKNDNNKKRKM